MSRWQWAVALGPGLALLAFHYLRLPALWHDEASLVLNVIGRNFEDFFGPLDYFCAAPPLFLAVERLVVLVCGDSLYALRLFPFLCSVASLILFAWVAVRILPAKAAFLGVLLFGVSDRFQWHGTEAKPYAVDLLVATSLLALFYVTRKKSLIYRIIIFSLPAPLLLWLSYPACFLYGGVVAALLPLVISTRSRMTWMAGATALAILGVSFILLTRGPVQAQRSASMDSCWTAMFPNWANPWLVPIWMVRSMLGVLHYCCQPIGMTLILPVILGIHSLWNRGERSLLALVLAPVGLACLASLFGAYPFGGARVLFFAAPAVLLLTGAGLERLLHVQRIGPSVVTVLLLAPLIYSVSHAVVPWPRANTADAARYVLERLQPEERVVCNCWEGIYYFRGLKKDLRAVYFPGSIEGSTSVWVMIVAAERSDREAVLAELSRGRIVIDRREYARTTVAHLSSPVSPAEEGQPDIPRDPG